MKKLAFLIIIAALMLCGCDNGESSADSGTSIPEIESSSDIGTPMPEIGTSETNSSTSEGTSETEKFPFNGMALPDHSLTVGNLPENVKETGTNIFFCCDENGEIYYANLADKGYLYHLNDGKPEMLVDIPASWITVVGDDIFFISPKTGLVTEMGFDPPKGSVYRYSKTDGQCEVYLEENNVKSIHAVADGLYYETMGEIKGGTAEVAMYFKDFRSGSSEKQSVNCWLETGGYHLAANKDTDAYCMTNGEDSVDIAAGDTMLFVNAFISQKKIYSFFMSTFRILDLETGEMTVYTKGDLAPFFEDYIPEITGSMVKDGCLYLCFQRDIILKIDEKGEITSCSCESIPSTSLLQLYTDGSDLYGCTKTDIYKIVFSEEEKDKFSVFKLGEEEAE